MSNKPETPLIRLKREHFPQGTKFPRSVLKYAGKLLKRDGPEATVKYLKGKGEPPLSRFQPKTKDLSPPVKAQIVGQSRPLEEWPIAKASKVIQEAIYSLSEKEFESLPEKLTSKSSHEKLFALLDVDPEFRIVQGLNLIIKNAVDTRKGVLKKVDNRNKERGKKLKGINERRQGEGLPNLTVELESAVDESGHLLYPPGINPSIFCYQQISPYIYDPSDPRGIPLPVEFEGYGRAPEDIIPVGRIDRLAIPKGSPGYVADHDRPGVVDRLGRKSKFNRKKISWGHTPRCMYLHDCLLREDITDRTTVQETKMSIRLAFTGASGTGKSTLALRLAKEFNLPMNPVGSRSVSKAMGFATPYDVDKAGRRGEFQHRLLEEKTKWENEREDFITDRTTFDNLSYTVLHDIHCIDQGMLDGARRGLERYTHIVYCPVRAFCHPGNDPDRVKSMIYHELHDTVLEGLHQRLGTANGQHPTRFLTLEVSGVDSRLGTIRTWLQNT